MNCFSAKRFGIKFFVWTALFIFSVIASQNIMAQSELQDYLDRDEPVYDWFPKDTIDMGNSVVHDVLLRSQRWKSVTWTHQLSIVVPKNVGDSGHCLLFVTGGSNRVNQPKWNNPNSDEAKRFTRIAELTGSQVAVLRQTPNQPLYGDKTEDELISFTFDQYLKTEDPTWPLLFPMVKSAVKAMDAIQEYSFKELSLKTDHFVVSGASKRGWTTWLTGAHDSRVVAIAPMVIDVLNMQEQMNYQLEFWGKYSPMIQDYTNLQIQDRMEEGAGTKLSRMVDPYTYREKITIPKFIFNGTNDPYWPADAMKFYYDDLVGEKYLHYVPNAGHGLGNGQQAVQALAAYYATVVQGKPHPNVTWKTGIERNALHLSVKGSDDFEVANVWVAESPEREFRDKEWKSTTLQRESRKPEVTAVVELPTEGYKALYAELLYPSPIGGTYSKATRVFVIDSNGILGKNIWR